MGSRPPGSSIKCSGGSRSGRPPPSGSSQGTLLLTHARKPSLFDVIGRDAQVAIDRLGLGGSAHVADAEDPASELAKPTPDADVVILQQPFDVVADVHARQTKRCGRHR